MISGRQNDDARSYVWQGCLRHKARIWPPSGSSSRKKDSTACRMCLAWIFDGGRVQVDLKVSYIECFAGPKINDSEEKQ